MARGISFAICSLMLAITVQADEGLVDSVSLGAGFSKAFNSLDSQNGGVDDVTDPDKDGAATNVSLTFNSKWFPSTRPYIDFTSLMHDDRDFNIPGAGLRYDFYERAESFQPFAKVGLGYVFASWDESPVPNTLSDQPDGESLDLVIQGGFDYYLTENLAVGGVLRLDTYDIGSVVVQDSKTTTINDNASLSALLTLTYRFSEHSSQQKVEEDKDSDKDGVLNHYDRCPDTLHNVPVNQYGCPMDMFEFTLEIKYAKFHIADLTQSPKFPVVEFLSRHPEYDVRITGYTDNVGSEAFNQQLSEKRANDAKDFLVDKGIAVERVSAIGKGEKNPIADNTSSDSRTKNRHITALFYKSDKVLPQ